jgi:hypothetical protein
MNKFIGDNEHLVRFLLLTCGLLTLAGAVVCLLWSNAVLAIACCIVSAWAIGTYLDAVWSGIVRAANHKQPDDAAEDNPSTQP